MFSYAVFLSFILICSSNSHMKTSNTIKKFILQLSVTENLNQEKNICRECILNFEIIDNNHTISNIVLSINDLWSNNAKLSNNFLFLTEIQFKRSRKIIYKLAFTNLSYNKFLKISRQDIYSKKVKEIYYRQLTLQKRTKITLLSEPSIKLMNKKEFYQELFQSSMVTVNCSTTKNYVYPELYIGGIPENRITKRKLSSNLKSLEINFIASIEDHDRQISCTTMRNQNNKEIKTMKIIHPPNSIKLEPEYTSLIYPGYSFKCLTDSGYPVPEISWEYKEKQNFSSNPFVIKQNIVYINSTAEHGTTFYLTCKSKYHSPSDNSQQILTKDFVFTIEENSQKILIFIGFLITILTIFLTGVLIYCIACPNKSKSRNAVSNPNYENVLYEAPCNLIRPNTFSENDKIFTSLKSQSCKNSEDLHFLNFKFLSRKSINN